jgi:hypothetical protein
MSKWLKKDAYEMFANEKTKEAEEQQEQGGFYNKWKNPKMGTTEKAKEYKIRLLPDVENGFYKKYMYHGFKSGETFKYFLCEKTHGMDKYCPWCEATKMLYQGNDSDKRKAGEYKRKERYVSNVYIVEDPRDAEVKDEAYKVSGKVRLYEFPATVESKIKNEITDTEQGYGMNIFNPEDGYDFILKIKAKPKDKNGKEWPDYGDTMFSRRSSPLADSEEEIEKIMESRFNLDEYINSLKLSVDEHEKLLKSEMLWEDVGYGFEKVWRKPASENAPAPTINTQPSESVEETSPTEQSQEETSTVLQTVESDDSTDQLLNELQDL